MFGGRLPGRDSGNTAPVVLEIFSSVLRIENEGGVKERTEGDKDGIEQQGQRSSRSEPDKIGPPVFSWSTTQVGEYQHYAQDPRGQHDRDYACGIELERQVG